MWIKLTEKGNEVPNLVNLDRVESIVPNAVGGVTIVFVADEWCNYVEDFDWIVNRIAQRTDVLGLRRGLNGEE